MADKTEQSEYLVFFLGNVRYALPVGRVEEVLEIDRITRVPRAPEMLRGIVNVRGRVVPVMDLHSRFDVSEGPVSEEADSQNAVSEDADPAHDSAGNTARESRYIVVTVRLGDEDVSLAATTDGVEGVVAIDPDQIDPPPKVGAGSGAGEAGEAVAGICRADEGILLILDPDRILTADYLAAAYNNLRATGEV